jgi:hypothetical protein
VSFLILFAAPGNKLRVAAETSSWMPQYDTLSVGEHLFLTIQWLVSSFANENRLFLCMIWIAGALLLYEKRAHPVWMAGTAVFLAAAFLSMTGITGLTDLGLQIEDITVCLYEVPQAAGMTAGNWCALLWWCMALIFTFFLLWRISDRPCVLLLIYLAGIASEAIMYFSPTIYASGARVYYLTDLLYLFLGICMSMQLKSRKRRQLFDASAVALGCLNFLLQIPILLENIFL